MTAELARNHIAILISAGNVSILLSSASLIVCIACHISPSWTQDFFSCTYFVSYIIVISTIFRRPMPLEPQNELFDRTAAILRSKTGKQPAIKLDPLDTTVPSYPSNRSSALSSVAESSRSFSASRTRFGRHSFHTPKELELPSVAHQQLQPNKPLPAAPQPRCSPKRYLQRFLQSPGLLLSPPLSARSAAFLAGVQSIVDTYLYHRSHGHTASPPHNGHVEAKRILTHEDSLEAQRQMSHSAFLPWWRKLIIAVCSIAVLATLVLLIVLVRVDHMGIRKVSHWLMAGSGTLIVLVALIMFAVRRPLSEVLVMAVLGVLICQCVMVNVHAGG